MKVTQISVFLENKSGRLADVTEILGQNQINIRALSVADTADFGILRLIVDQPAQALKVLKKEGLTVKETAVITLRVPDRPGGLAGVLRALEEKEVNIEYMYAFVGKSQEDAVVVFRVEEIDRAVTLLKGSQISVLTEGDVYRL